MTNWQPPRFRLRSLAALAAFIAILLAWRNDHLALQEQIVRLRGPHLLGYFPQREAAALKTGANDLLAFGDGSVVLCANGTAAELWDMSTGEKLLALQHPEPIVAMALSPDERFLITLTAGSCSPARCWDLESGTIVCQYLSPLSAVQTPTKRPWNWTIWTPDAANTFGFTSAAFAPSGHVFATGCEDGAITLWDMKTGQRLKRLAGKTKRIRRIVFSPDGTKLLATSEDHDVQLWGLLADSRTFHLRHERTKTLNMPPVPVAFSPDGELFAFCFNHTLNPIRIYYTNSGIEDRRYRDRFHYSSHISFLPDGKLVVASSGALRVQQLPSGEETLRHSTQIRYAGGLFTARARYVQYLPIISAVLLAAVENHEQTLHEDRAIIQIVPLTFFKLPESGSL